MTPGNGTDIPGMDEDVDRDGIPDAAERDFARDGETTRSTDPRTDRRTHPAAPKPDDGGLESTRTPRGDVVPPPSN